MPYWTLDIGGFFVQRKPEMWFWSGDYDAGVADLGYRELYVRWFQYGVFLPMLRAHGTDTPRELWRFGEPGDPMFDTLTRFLHLRYQLLPYIYSLAGWSTHQDYTMLRALPFDFRADPATYNVCDQFMFGPAFLVNPVTQAMLYAAGSTPLEGISQTRPVYLPAGTDWYDFWNDQKYHGGQTLLADAPLERLPLYVRAGSIVPMGPRRQHVDDRPDAPVELHIYPGSDGTFLLYEDEGDSYNYETGAFTTIPMRWHEASAQLHMGERSGSYPGMLEKREFCLVLHAAPGKQAAERTRTFTYTGTAIVVPA
jgi:alpha-D-xyloside xylohydrolase